MNIKKQAQWGVTGIVGTLIVVILIAVVSINEIRMGGPLQRANQLNSDLVADILPPGLNALAEDLMLERATQWGLAIRLAQRLSGGVGGPLRGGRVRIANGRLELCLPHEYARLYGEAVQRRLRQLGQAMSLEHGCVIES